MKDSNTALLAAEPMLRKPAVANTNGRRGSFLKWLRKTHSWIGLWGALLGLMFGLTGFFQNHRAVMKIEAGSQQVSTLRLNLPSPAPSDPDAMNKWLQQELKLPRPAERVQREKAHPVAWGDQSAIQPERWQLNFRAPNYTAQAEYWVGANQVNVRRVEPGIMGVLENLHRANGVGVAWVLIADTIAGAMILLSLTGVLLWTGLNKRRTVGAAIFGVSIVATLFVVNATLG
ncbi:PepSY-associated TM helix domain-containing protein [Bordetella sp. N]|uniref:PepSY-associated TM helix domain-containing protein n=1 Tax=Bordetella sp. N TaxID=1746199 RepID=UPI00071034DD|nr:PepSY-associated TM helix domain-containing protein [Bordetella sp. N]ALM87352.1 peptidase [Bordetella sp. N]